MKKIAKDVWIFEGEAVNFHSFPYTTRMTVVLLDGGDLWVHSPIRLDSEIKVKIESLGQVKYLIAPNHLHHIFIKDWQQVYPDALTYGTEEVIKKRNDLEFTGVLGAEVNPHWVKELEQLLFTGSPAMQEAVFFHKASNVLIVTDLIENFSPNAFSFFKKQIAKFAGVLAPNGKMPIDWRYSFYFNKAEARRHVKTIISWKPKTIILSHGLIIEDDAEAFMRESFKWVGL